MVPTKRLRFGTFPLYSRTLLLLLLLKKGRDASSSSWFHLGYYVNPKLKRGVSLSLSLSLSFRVGIDTTHLYRYIAFVDCCGPTTRKKKKKTKKTKKKEEENFELSPLPVTHNERQSRLFFLKPSLCALCDDDEKQGVEKRPIERL